MGDMFKQEDSVAQQQDELWNEFRGNRSPLLRRELVLRYLNLIRYVMTRFGLDHAQKNLSLEREDIFEFGVLGLLDAVDRFNPATGVKFETYAISRIRGSIVDEIRKLDWIPRSVRKNTKTVSDVVSEIEGETGREPLDTEIADKLMISIEEYQQLVRDTVGLTSSGRERDMTRQEIIEGQSLIDRQTIDSNEMPDEEEERKRIISVIESLPNRERIVIALYYYEGLKFAEIGSIMRLSESRVSQIHGAVLKMLRTKLAVL
jgi:RNA polymerase sigma factor FliA